MDEGVMTKLGLTLNEAKTSLRDARPERYTFLGYSFGPHHPYNPSARMYLYMSASPSKKSVQRLKTKVRELLMPGNNAPWPEVRDDLTGHSGVGRATSIWDRLWQRSAVLITMFVSACAAFSPDGTRWQSAATVGSHTMREVQYRDGFWEAKRPEDGWGFIGPHLAQYPIRQPPPMKSTWSVVVTIHALIDLVHNVPSPYLLSRAIREPTQDIWEPRWISDKKGCGLSRHEDRKQ